MRARLAVVCSWLRAKRPNRQGSSRGNTVLTAVRYGAGRPNSISPYQNLATTALSTNQSQSTLLATDAKREEDSTARQIWAAQRRRMEVQNTQFGPDGPRSLWRSGSSLPGWRCFTSGLDCCDWTGAEGAMRSIFSSWLVRYRFQTCLGHSMVIAFSISAIRISIACRSWLQLPAGSSPGSRWTC